jgi:hypothetical protein
MNDVAREEKKGGGIVFVAIFLGPFIGGAAVAIARAMPDLPMWAPIAALALVHWIVTAQFTRARTTARNRIASMLIWSVAAVVADVAWFGVLLTLAAAWVGAP